MSLTALIDGDLIAFINASSAEGDDEKIAFLRADRHIRNILDEVQADKYQVYLSGGRNFRYDINASYKANRTGPDPIHRKATHMFLLSEWSAIETNGYEADDALGCEQNEETVICSLDKDLLMIPGRHYSWPIMRKKEVIRDHTYHQVDVLTGLKHFYRQMLIGDTADNIIGIRGIGKAKAAKIIEGDMSEEDMYHTVLHYYTEENYPDGFKRFLMNADCLWIWRSLGVNYTIRSEHLINASELDSRET